MDNPIGRHRTTVYLFARFSTNKSDLTYLKRNYGTQNSHPQLMAVTFIVMWYFHGSRGLDK